MRGVVKKLVAEKGFGFLTVEGRSEDLFFHASAVKGGRSEFESLREGDSVLFSGIADSGKGDAAVDVEHDPSL